MTSQVAQRELALDGYPTLSGEGIRRQAWAIANLLRAAGLNALETIEHASLFLFLRLLETANGNTPASIDGLDGGELPELLDTCRTAPDSARHFSDVTLRQLEDAVRGLPSQHPARVIVDGFQFRLVDGTVTRKLIDITESMALSFGTQDLNGAIYERLVASLAEAGHWGQYFTPRHIVEAVVDLVAPGATDSVHDPAAGTGGFLTVAASYVSRNAEGPCRLSGRELNPAVRRLCVMNLLTHGLDPTHLWLGDSLSIESRASDRFDVVVTNPPFAGTVASREGLATYPIDIRSSEGLFLQHVLDVLRPGGRAGIVCPEGLLANLGAEKELRRQLLERASIDAVISLPGGVFNPYTGVRTGIMFFEKRSKARSVWFFDVRADGFELDARRRPSTQDDIPALKDSFLSRRESAQSCSVDLSELEENDLRLVASRYLARTSQSHGRFPQVPLRKVCSVVKESICPQDHGDRHFHYLALEHVESQTGLVGAPPPTLGGAIRSTKTIFAKGDVMYGKLRPYLAKVALASSDGICSTEFVVLRPDSGKVLGEYLAAVLRTRPFTERASALMVGANHPRIHPRDLLSIDVPIPDLDIQQTVVTSLQKHEAELDSLRQRTGEIREAIAARGQSLWE